MPEFLDRPQDAGLADAGPGRPAVHELDGDPVAPRVDGLPDFPKPAPAKGLDEFQPREGLTPSFETHSDHNSAWGEGTTAIW